MCSYHQLRAYAVDIPYTVVDCEPGASKWASISVGVFQLQQQQQQQQENVDVQD
jgi:hypothetical protein